MLYDDGQIHIMDGKRVKVIDVYGRQSIENLKLSIKVFEDIRNGEYSKNMAVIKKGTEGAVVYTFPSYEFIGISNDTDIMNKLKTDEQILVSIYPGEQVGDNLMKFKMFAILGEAYSDATRNSFRSVNYEETIIVNGNRVTVNIHNFKNESIKEDSKYVYVDLEGSAFKWEINNVNSLLNDEKVFFTPKIYTLTETTDQLHFSDTKGIYGTFRVTKVSYSEYSSEGREQIKIYEAIASSPNTCVAYLKELYNHKLFNIEDYKAILRVAIPKCQYEKQEKTFHYGNTSNSKGEITLKDLIYHPLADMNYHFSDMNCESIKQWMSKFGIKEDRNEPKCFSTSGGNKKLHGVEIDNFEFLGINSGRDAKRFMYNFEIPFDAFYYKDKKNYMNKEEDVREFLKQIFADFEKNGIEMKMQSSFFGIYDVEANCIKNGVKYSIKASGLATNMAYISIECDYTPWELKK